MASNSRADGYPQDGGRSGGKIMRQKRVAAYRTPYDRPVPPPEPPNPVEKPANWLSTAGNLLKSGAGMLFSTVLGSDSSSDESGSDWSSDDEADNNVGREFLPVAFSSEAKQKIEELLLLETFSRVESDWMIHIIKSRTVDAPVFADNQGMHMSDLSSSAVLEARKWIAERKMEKSGSKTDLDYGTFRLSSAIVPQVADGGAGSPVDVARTYMSVRPPWASPTAGLSEIRNVSPIKIQNLTSGSQYCNIGAGLSSQTKKREFVGSGSWSIVEETRKVRARATDEMLSTPSKKLDLAALKHGTEEKAALTDGVDVGNGGNLPGLSSFNLAGSSTCNESADKLQQEPVGMDMEVLAAEATCQGNEVKDMERLKVGTSNGFPGAPIMPEGVIAEPNPRPTDEMSNPASPTQEGIPTNSQTEELSQPDGSQPDSFPTDAILVVQAAPAAEKQQRGKKPGRRGRGKGK